MWLVAAVLDGAGLSAGNLTKASQLSQFRCAYSGCTDINCFHFSIDFPCHVGMMSGSENFLFSNRENKKKLKNKIIFGKGTIFFVLYNSSRSSK